MVATIQIPNLPAATALNGTEQFEAVQAGMSVRVTANQLSAAAGGFPPLTPSAAPGQMDLYSLVFWGDSYVYGRGGEDPSGGPYTPFEAQLIDYLGFRNFSNQGVSGQSTDLILARVQASASMHNWINFFEGGLNDLTDMGPTQAWEDHIVANFAAMVATVDPGVPYYIIGLVNSGREWAESSYGQLFIDRYFAILAANVRLAGIYGDKFIDVRAMTIANGLEVTGITPTSQDLIDLANDIPPTSLRRDLLNVHPNTPGLQAVAFYISTVLEAHYAAQPQYSMTWDTFQSGIGLSALAAELIAGQTVNAFAGYYMGDGLNEGVGPWTTGNVGDQEMYVGWGRARASGATPGVTRENTIIGITNIAPFTTTQPYTPSLIGRQNVILGKDAFALAVDASFNTGQGYQALQSGADIQGCAAFGYATLSALLTGTGYTAIGMNALANCMSANPSTAGGYQAMINFVTGTGTAFGYQAMSGGRGISLVGGTTSGSNVVSTTTNPVTAGVANGMAFYGTSVPSGTTVTGTSSTTITLSANATATTASPAAIFIVGVAPPLAFVGNTYSGNATVDASPGVTTAGVLNGMPIVGTNIQAGSVVVSFTANSITMSLPATATSPGSLQAVFRVGGVSASNNFAFGRGALTAIVTGANNGGFGLNTLNALRTGSGCIAIGTSSQAVHTNRSNNLSIGTSTLAALLAGDASVIIGHQGASVATAIQNTVAIGHQVLLHATSGANGGAILGYQGGLAVTTAANLTLLGNSSGIALTTGGAHTFVGANSGATPTTATGCTILGAGIDLPNTNNQLSIVNAIYGERMDGAGTTPATGNICVGGVPTGAGAAKFQVAGDISLTGFIDGTEISAPASPAANGGRIYFQDNGAGKTQLLVLFNTGPAQLLALQL